MGDLSIYVDIRHIKYRDSVQRPDLHTFPLLSGNGHFTWALINPAKHEPRTTPLATYAQGWQISLDAHHFSGWSGFGLVFRPVFLPQNLSKSGLRVRVKVRCVLEIQGSDDVVLVHSLNHRLDDTKYMDPHTSRHIIDLHIAELAKAYCMTLDIQWQIISAGTDDNWVCYGSDFKAEDWGKVSIA